MVHVLTGVLRKVRKALRDNGILLIKQPAQENSLIEVEMDGKVKLSEELYEPNFQIILNATRLSISNVVEEGLFRIEFEATTPRDGSFHCNEYDSVQEWIEDHISFCEDLATFNAMSERIQRIVDGKTHHIFEYWREYSVLLRKSISEEARSQLLK